MNFRGCVNVLSEPEMTKIEDAAKSILANTGFHIQHAKILERLAQAGYTVDFNRQVVRFTENQLEDFLCSAEPLDWDNLPPFRVQSGLYTWQWLDPVTDKVLPSTVESTIDLTRLFDYLPNLDTSPGMGTPSDVPAPLVPLWQYYIAWRHAEKSDSRGGGIFNLQCLPYMDEMAQIMISEKGGSKKDYLEIGIEFISPLTFGRYEAEVFYETASRGMNPVLMSMPSIGGTAPVTIAGALALTLSEIWVTNILHRLFVGKKQLRYLASAAPLDMRSGSWRFGRPETAMTQMALGQLAKRRKALYHSNCFVCDAQRPSCEAGYEKAMTLLPSVLAGSVCTGSCGMLSVDEYNSPVQMIIDNEFAGAVKHMASGFEISDDTLALGEIAEAGFGGSHLTSDFTAERFRSELWMPHLWTPWNDGGWLSHDCKTDTDEAKEIYLDVLKNYHPIGVGEGAEKALLDVISHADKDLIR